MINTQITHLMFQYSIDNAIGAPLVDLLLYRQGDVLYTGK